MKIYLDSANIEKIEAFVEPFCLAGVTCNPSILKKDNGNIRELVKTVADNKELFIQSIQETTEGMIDDARKIVEIRNNAIIKIPATYEGLKAIVKLESEGIHTLATAIYSAEQAMMAANCGAEYVAPYVNRMCNLGIDGVEETLKLQDAFRTHEIDCQIVAASFKNMSQIKKLILNGVDSVTVPVDLFEIWVKNQNAEKAVKDFKADWKQLTGVEKIL